MIKKIIGISLSLIFLLLAVDYVFSPIVADALNSSQNFTVTLQVSGELYISAPGDATFTTGIPGISGNLGNPATASSSFNVIAINPAGFSMTIGAPQQLQHTLAIR